MRTFFKFTILPLAMLFCLHNISFAEKIELEGDGSILKIISPENGAVVGEEIEIKYHLQKGTEADHVHAYVDGKYQKGFKGTLSGLAKGKHEIVLKVANSDHDVIAISARTVVEVK